MLAVMYSAKRSAASSGVGKTSPWRSPWCRLANDAKGHASPNFPGARPGALHPSPLRRTQIVPVLSRLCRS